MRKLLALMTIFLMALVLFAGPLAPGATASAIIPCEMATEVAASGHLPGDADEVPADKDRGTPHHHGVGHGHDIGVGLTAYFSAVSPPVRGTMHHWDAPTPSSVAPSSDLRPPIA